MTTRALISVSDKTGIVELARSLASDGIELVSTGGTAAALRDAGLTVLDAGEVTGQPEVMGGRVKTLHPRLHGGLLARRDEPTDMQDLAQLGGEPIDVVVCNLYPFRATIERPDVTRAEAVEQIDIGGPSMIRAAAKNHASVVVLVDPADYPRAAEAMRDDQLRLQLAAKAFRHVAAYDAVIAQYLTEQAREEFPEQLTMTFDKVQDLRYGENPHQSAALYAHPTEARASLVDATFHQGKELSYNNLADADAALAIVREFDEPAAVIVKHVNPCGVAVAATVGEAWAAALDADPVSAFGGIVAVNRPVDAALAEAMTQLFLEVVIAPGYDARALELLAAKKNLRVLEVAPGALGAMDAAGGGVGAGDPAGSGSGTGMASALPVTSMIRGGMLMQAPDVHAIVAEQLKTVTVARPTDAQLADLLFGWRVVKHVTSNAVVLAGGGRTLGIGAGQMNRVGSAKIAIEAAGDRARGSVLASDAFFPMPDSIDAAAAAGIAAIIQPGGSRRDADVIAACDDAGIAMVFTGVRHFRH